MTIFLNIVIHTREETVRQINEQSKTIYQGKLKVMNIIAERTKKDTRVYKLVEDQSELLRDLNTYLPKLMFYLWEQHKVVVSVIKNSEIESLKKYIAPLLANNFYENILSSYYIEDNLMYVLTLLLEDEINGLTNINQDENFLKDTPCGCVLEELRRKNDIQAFFKSIIFNAVEDLEVNYSPLRFDFNISRLTDEYRRSSIKEPKNKKRKKRDEGYLKYPTDNQSDSISLEDGSVIRDKKKLQMEQENFNKKYIPPLDKTALQKVTEEFKSNNNTKLYDYCYSKLNECNSNQEIFSNKKLMQNLYTCEYSQELLLKYQNYFTIVISFIDSIIEKIKNNFHLLPYSVKCLCKIISLLITKKFPSISETEKNSFIAKFFFGKLLVPILKNPGIEAFISNFIISRNTLNNLSVICEIINKFTSGHFYMSNTEYSDLTPFNWYFIEKMENLFNIFEHITKVRLPSFIEKFIKGELPTDYEYNYFEENPDEDINHRSICFNLDQVKALLETMNKHQNLIFTSPKSTGLKKTMEKLMSPTNQKLLQNILNTENPDNKKIQLQTQKSKKKEDKIKEKDKEKDKEEDPNIVKVHYFLLTTLLTNDRYKELFNIEQNTINFSLKELKTVITDEQITKNNIIKVKNFFCSLLYNYNKLVKTDFDEGTTENTEKILKELNIFMKSSNFVVDDSIPSEWYVKSLLEYLKKIPKDLTENDCEKLYNDIENDVKNSIKSLDIEALSVIMGKLKFAKRGFIYYEESRKLLVDISLNEETKEKIENEFIPVDIKFFLNEDNESGKFEITPCNFKEKDRFNSEKIKEYEKSKKVKLCLTIDMFTKKFPNLVQYQELQDADILEIQKTLEFSSKLNFYFNLIKTNFEKKGITGLEDKIYNYVMSKIYDKIYPIEPYELDNKIFQQSVRLSWTEPKHFFKSKREFVFGSFLSDVINYFKLIDSEKSPKKKLLNLIEIFNSIGFLLKFNGTGNDAGVDDQMPILNYAFVKAQPLRMYSNAKFMELYIGEKKNKFEGSQLTQLLGICDFIAKIKYNELIDVSNEEFIKKCNAATSGEVTPGNQL